MTKSFQLSTPPPVSSNLGIPIFQKTYDFYKNFHEALKHFPRQDRYSVGQKCVDLNLDILELVLLAGYKSKNEKLVYLERASAKLDVLKILLRLSFETKAINQQKYISFESLLIEIGKMLGGWIKQAKTT